MKFKLEQKGSRYADADLIADLRRVSEIIRRRYVSRPDYETYGKYNRSKLSKRFGSWRAAHQRAGLDYDVRDPVSKEELLEDLRRVARELGREYVSLSEHREHGRWSNRPYYRNFGGWLKALAAAGLREHPQFKHRISEREYFENLERMWRTLGRQPRYGEVGKPFSAISAGAYEGRFESWRKALEAFIEYIEDPDQSETVEEIPQLSYPEVPPKEAKSFESVARRRTPRVPSLRLRFLVMRRDSFRCCQCGRSPAASPGLELHIDHIQAWSQGGETKVGNLQTLCTDCNLGKGDLSRDAEG